MSFNENLRNELIYQDVCIKEYASRINIPYGTFLTYINSVGSLPNVEKGYLIAKELNVTVEYLVTGKNNNIPIKNGLYQTIIELQSLPSEQINLVKDLVRFLYISHKKEKNES